MMDGITHAIATCDRIERGLTDAAGRAKHALAEMQIELQNMLDAINADRSARGVAPLDVMVPRLPHVRTPVQTSRLGPGFFCPSENGTLPGERPHGRQKGAELEPDAKERAWSGDERPSPV